MLIQTPRDLNHLKRHFQTTSDIDERKPFVVELSPFSWGSENVSIPCLAGKSVTAQQGADVRAYSLLDLSPITDTGSARQALQNPLDLAADVLRDRLNA